jgi:hypothetical protein
MAAGEATTPTVLRSQPGIKRDGTKYDGDFYVDGQWVRFQRGLPRKIGGYRSISKYLTEISRGFTTFTQQRLQYCHSGSATLLERFTIDASKNSSIVSDRTPAGLTASAENRWMFQYMYDSSSTDNSIIAHVAPNGSCACNDVGGEIYIGDVLGTAALSAITLPAGANATGGIVVLHPYLFYYGTAGVIGHSVPGDPTDLSGVGSGISRPWGQKIIKGMPLRAGAGSAPAGLFWAWDAVLRATFTGSPTVFQYDVIATDTSILSADCVVDYDGVFYWAGVDRFLMFNGVVRDVPNSLNLNYFYDGLNPNQHSKVFAFKVPRYGEIWWCYPRGDASECTHAVIYNVRENTWYDTALPASFRSAGTFNNGFAAPLLTDAVPTPDGYRVWIHEQGADQIDGQRIEPVQSYFETADLSSLPQGADAALRITSIEPDFVQSGAMSVRITGRANARAPEVVSSAVTFPASATQPYEQIVMLKQQRRELRVRFESFEVGGDYQMGQIIGHIGPADGTVLG